MSALYQQQHAVAEYNLLSKMNINSYLLTNSMMLGLKGGGSTYFSNQGATSSLLQMPSSSPSMMVDSRKRSESEIEQATFTSSAPLHKKQRIQSNNANSNSDGSRQDTMEINNQDSAAETTCNAQSSKWIAKYLELVEFKRVHGHTAVPTKWSENFGLAQWVKRQRYQYQLKKAGKASSLTTQRQLLLEQAQFVWDLHDAVWDERFNDLVDFQNQHGHCKVPSKYPMNPDLAIWAKCQRRHFSTFCAHTSAGKEWTSNTMSMDRILKLAKVGFVFDNRSDKGALEALILNTKPS